MINIVVLLSRNKIESTKVCLKRMDLGLLNGSGI